MECVLTAVAFVKAGGPAPLAISHPALMNAPITVNVTRESAFATRDIEEKIALLGISITGKFLMEK